MTELKPCPFCGGKPKVYNIGSNIHPVWKVMCGARVDCCLILNEYATPEEAMAAWNRRVAND